MQNTSDNSIKLDLNNEVDYEYTEDPFTAIRWLNNLKKLAAFDFETASKYTKEEKEKFKKQLQILEDKPETAQSEEARILRQYIASNGLSHPSLSRITHISFADSPIKAKVVVFTKSYTLKTVLNWLVMTNTTQVWHNAGFDLKLIYYHTGKFPKYFEDSQLLAKSILNHVNDWESQVGLKHLMGYKYGKWAVAPDMFKTENFLDETLIKYAAIDAAATYSLWQELQNFLKEQ